MFPLTNNFNNFYFAKFQNKQLNVIQKSATQRPVDVHLQRHLETLPKNKHLSSSCWQWMTELLMLNMISCWISFMGNQIQTVAQCLEPSLFPLITLYIELPRNYTIVVSQRIFIVDSHLWCPVMFFSLKKKIDVKLKSNFLLCRLFL